MAFSKMINPKKKRRVKVVKDSPFPVPIATEQASDWFYYTGYLHDNYVKVKHSGDIDRLYKMGFFGKGTLSRSKPEFNQNYRFVNVPNKNGEIVSARVMSRRSYIHRLNWALAKDRKPPAHTEYDSSDDQYEEMEQTPMIQTDAKDDKELVSKQETIGSSDGVPGMGVRPEKSLDELSKFWETSNTGCDIELWEENEDFWNTDSTVINITSEQDTKDDLQKSDESVIESQNKSKHLQSDWTEGAGVDNNGQEFNFMNEHSSDKALKNVLTETGYCMVVKSPGESEQNEIENKESSCDHESGQQSKTCADVQISCQRGICHDETLTETCADMTDTSKSDIDIDSLCRSDDEEGNLFVIDDSDSEVESGRKRKIRRKKWRPVLKRDPHFIEENLHLSFEESFFLSYGLGCLVVKDQQEKTPDLTEMWQIFSSRQKTFIPNYIAYHYYRSKGWVPKTGLKFGTDFLIYKEGPAFYHGSYSVIVKIVIDKTLADDPRFPIRNLTWTNLAGLNRLTEQVAKEVLICHVIRPHDLTDQDLMSPDCIPKFQIKEVLLSRWVSSQEREKKTEEIP